jgi:hypothetical protein
MFLTVEELLEIVEWYNERCEIITSIKPFGTLTDLMNVYSANGVTINMGISLGFGLEMRCDQGCYHLCNRQGILKTWIDNDFDKIQKPRGI